MEGRMVLGMVLMVVGLVGTMWTLSSMLQFSIVPMALYERTDVSGNKIAVAKWVRTKGPGTATDLSLMSLYTVGDPIAFGGYVEVDANSPRPIVDGRVRFEVYGPADDYKITLRDEKCYLKRVYCGDYPCTSAVKVFTFDVGRIDPGEKSAGLEFQVYPEELPGYGKYVTIMYVQDMTYTEEGCSFPVVLAIDYWEWEYGPWGYVRWVRVVKTIGAVIFPFSLISGLLLIWRGKFW